MTDGPVPDAMAARARQAGEAPLRARPWLGGPYPGADVAGRNLCDRRRSILIGLWLAGAVAFVLLGVFAASAPRFPGDLWVSRQVQAIDSVAFTRAADWAEDLGDAPETTRSFGREIECSQFVNDFPSCVLLSLTTPNVVVVFMGAVGVLLLFRRRYEAALLLSTGGALVTIAALERIVARPQHPRTSSAWFKNRAFPRSRSPAVIPPGW